MLAMTGVQIVLDRMRRYKKLFLNLPLAASVTWDGKPYLYVFNTYSMCELACAS
jgi:hypothetical protein